MKTKVLATTVVIAAFTTPALADFWIVQDFTTTHPNNHYHCWQQGIQETCSGPCAITPLSATQTRKAAR
jgi:hypothetical protein